MSTSDDELLVIQFSSLKIPTNVEKRGNPKPSGTNLKMEFMFFTVIKKKKKKNHAVALCL